VGWGSQPITLLPKAVTKQRIFSALRYYFIRHHIFLCWSQSSSVYNCKSRKAKQYLSFVSEVYFQLMICYCHFNFRAVHFVLRLGITKKMHQFLSVYYFTLLLLHVSATVCHPQGARPYLLSYMPFWIMVDKILKYKETNSQSFHIIWFFESYVLFMAECTSKSCTIWQEYTDICVDVKYIKI
jgi:hypothetical protein